jgi:hypothetical protein
MLAEPITGETDSEGIDREKHAANVAIRTRDFDG